jgi:hypothetical protein
LSLRVRRCSGDPKVTDLVALEFTGHTHVSWPSDCPIRLLTAQEAVTVIRADPDQHWVWPVWSILVGTDSRAHLLVASYVHNVLTIFDPFLESVGQWMSDYPILHNLWKCLGKPTPYYWVYGRQRANQRDCVRRSFNYLNELCASDKDKVWTISHQGRKQARIVSQRSAATNTTAKAPEVKVESCRQLSMMLLIY